MSAYLPQTELDLIAEMETILDDWDRQKQEFERVQEAWRSCQQQMNKLQRYYDSGRWLMHYESYDQGRIPETLKCGVLSQDAIYNALCEEDELRKGWLSCAEEIGEPAA